jgi:DNA polymerase III subunit delta
MYFDDFLTRIKKETIPSALLFFGDSESAITEGAQIAKEKFKRNHLDGTFQIFDGGENALRDVLDAARTTGLFSTAQLLVVKRAEKTLGGHSEKNLQQLKDYFSNPPSGSFLVFLAPGMRKTAKAVSAVERLGWAVQCSDMPDWKIVGWLRKQATEMDLNLSDEGAQLLIQKVGTDLAYLQRALEQLVVYALPGKNASAKEVKDLPAPGMESEIFTFLDAAGLRQSEAALRSLNQLGDGVDTGVIMMLYSRVRELLAVSMGRSKGFTQGVLAEKLGLHPFRVKTLWDQVGQFSANELKSALLDLIHIQAGVVTGRLGKRVPTVWLEWWILKWGKNRMAFKGATR